MFWLALASEGVTISRPGECIKKDAHREDTESSKDHIRRCFSPAKVIFAPFIGCL